MFRAARAFPRADRSSAWSDSDVYFGGVEAGADDMAPPLLLLSAGAAGGVAALLSAGGVAIGAAGAAAGVAESWLLLQAESTSAAAKALRTSFVFIDESPEWYVRRPIQTGASELVRGRKKLAPADSIESAAYFKLPAAAAVPRSESAGEVCRTGPDFKPPRFCACAAVPGASPQSPLPPSSLPCSPPFYARARAWRHRRPPRSCRRSPDRPPIA
jgi:hypothetical protein